MGNIPSKFNEIRRTSRARRKHKNKDSALSDAVVVDKEVAVENVQVIAENVETQLVPAVPVEQEDFKGEPDGPVAGEQHQETEIFKGEPDGQIPIPVNSTTDAGTDIAKGGPSGQSTAPIHEEMDNIDHVPPYEPNESHLKVNLEISKTWQPETSDGDTRVDERRRFHAVESSSYPMPADIGEQNRLNMVHLLYRYGFNEQFHMPIHVEMMQNGLKLLDVGCGSAAWTRDVAYSYPLSHVWGVDMAKNAFDGVDMLPNMTLVEGNVLERLPFEDNTFDGVYMRLMIVALTTNQWVTAIKECMRVLKPGGYLELTEPDMDAMNVGPNYWKVYQGSSEAMISRGFDVKIASKLHKYMTDAGLKIVKEKTCSFPIGWGGQVGDLHLANFQQTALALKPFLIKAFAVTTEEYDKMLMDAVAECPVNKSYYNATAIVGQKL
ncbi:hypothetical protein HK098_001709 [Nowakowskiella sp. JEL0407]|nr:hypothetical protein HK098_001709 [Nowakowskiella sp. JEL0407]